MTEKNKNITSSSINNNSNSNSSLPPTYILPSDNEELTSFSKKFKPDMMDQITKTIEFALTNNLQFVEVFQFKNSDFVIGLSKKDYLTNLDNIYSYYMKTEIYENCPKIIKLKELLLVKNTIINEKK